MTLRIPTYLVSGNTSDEREAAIVSAIQRTFALNPSAINAVLIEGLPSQTVRLTSAQNTQVVRIAPACLCCDGNLIFRVHLNRLIQKKPAQLFISTATQSHLQQIRTFLSSDGYENKLKLMPTIAL